MLNRTTLRKAIASRLKEAREQAGYLSAEDFCESNKIRLIVYLKQEQGKTAIKLSQAERYCKLLAVSFRWLMLGENASKSYLPSQNMPKEVRYSWM